MQKALITLGMLLILIGILWPILEGLNIGRLPGDLIIKKKQFNFYFPLTTCVVISLIFSIILWFLKK